MIFRDSRTGHLALAGLAVLLALAPLGHAQDGQLDPTFSGDGVVFGPLDNANILDVLVDGQKGPVVVGQYRSAAFDSDAFIARYGPEGELDPVFNGDGFATLDAVGSDDGFQAVAVYDDGPYAVAGFSDDLVLVARYLDGGSLDQAFGTGGVATFSAGAPAGAFQSATDIAVAPGGGLYVAGVSTTPAGTREQFLARLTPTGALDPTFGDGGLARVGLVASEAYALALDSAGRIVLAGRIDRGTSTDMLVARVLPSGDLDTSFSGVGAQTINLGGPFNTSNDVVVRPDGGLYLIGTSDGPATIIAAAAGEAGTLNSIAVVSLTETGMREADFGTDGAVVISLSTGEDEGYAGALDRDGRLVVAGSLIRSGAGALVRLLGTGALDPAFGIDSAVRAIYGQSTSFRAVALDQDDSIYAAGIARLSQTVTGVLARYTTRRSVAGDATPGAPAALTIAPNPMRGTSRVSFTLDAPTEARITLIDALGRTVATLADARLGAGDHAFPLDAARLPAGVYAVVARLGADQTVRRVTVVR